MFVCIFVSSAFLPFVEPLLPANETNPSTNLHTYLLSLAATETKETTNRSTMLPHLTIAGLAVAAGTGAHLHSSFGNNNDVGDVAYPSNFNFNTNVNVNVNGPKPTANQLRMLDNGLAQFMHFSVDPFTSIEHNCVGGNPDCVPASVFNPTNLSTDSWVEAAVSFGATEICLTAHHEGGFCLWDTAYSNYRLVSRVFDTGIGIGIGIGIGFGFGFGFSRSIVICVGFGMLTLFSLLLGVL